MDALVDPAHAPLRTETARRRAARLPAAALPWLGLLPGVAALKWAYSDAAHSHTTAHFHIFWLGIALFVLPAAVRLAGRTASDRERYALLITLGAFLFVPKLLRDPSMPLFHDELAHWRQTEELLGTGTAFHTNYTIYVIGQFPGLHTLAAAIVLMTGLSVWHAATLLLVVLHIVALLGVADLALTVTKGNVRVAGIAALIFALNPSYMFFHAQFAYESLSIVFFIWVLAAVARFTDRSASRSTVAAWFTIGVLLALACVTTHHLATYTLVILLIAASASSLFLTAPNERRRRIPLLMLTFTSIAVAAAGLWAAFAAPDVVGYLAPQLTGGVDQLVNILSHKAASHGVFHKSTLPLYERLLGAGSVPVLALGSFLGSWMLWRRRPLSSLPVLLPSLVVLGLIFFVSLPFVFSARGAESAHRSWGYSFIGLAVLIAPAVAALADRASHLRRVAKLAVLTAIAAGFATVLIGMVADGTSAPYRFPGPYVWGSDTLSLNAEMLVLTRRFRQKFGVNQKVIADNYSSLALASFGNEQTAEPARGFPTWELYFDAVVPSSLLHEIAGSGWRFVVVDERMSSVIPLQSFYIAPGERQSDAPVTPPPRAALAKFDHVPWARLVLTTQHYHVYMIDPSKILGQSG